MAKSKYQKPTKSRSTPLSSDLLRPANLSRQGSKLKVSPSNDLSKLSLGTRLTSKGVDFGSPSDKGTRSSLTQQNNNWTGLLQSVATGGVSDLLGGSGILSAGLDYLTSGLKNFFGGDERTVNPLVRFELPEAQDRAVNTAGFVAPPEASSNGSSITTSYGLVQLSSRSTNVQKAQIVQTIKNALLTSSSLNDIIGEL